MFFTLRKTISTSWFFQTLTAHAELMVVKGKTTERKALLCKKKEK
jgi:hypothetical protein